MSADAKITLQWGEGETVFRLAIGELRELQAKLDAGPQALWTRLMDGSWKVDDLVETIRLALIGGGTSPADARRLVDYYVIGRPLLESRSTAIAVLGAALIGVQDDPVGKEAAPEPAPEASASNGPASMASAA